MINQLRSKRIWGILGIILLFTIIFYFGIRMVTGRSIGVLLGKNYSAGAGDTQPTAKVKDEVTSREQPTILKEASPQVELMPPDQASKEAMQDMAYGAHPAVDSSVSALNFLRDFNELAMKSLTPGWLHVREERIFDTDTDNNGILPNGSPIPSHQINDIWYHLNADLLVDQMVFIMKDVEGQVVQVGVKSNGTGWNSATNETTTEQLTKLTGLDANFYRDTEWLIGFGKTASVSQVTLLDGKEGLQFTIDDTFDSPKKSFGYQKLTTGIRTTGVFNTKSGYLDTKEVLVTFEDGSQRIFQQLKQQVNYDTPTAEVFSYLTDLEKEVIK